ncbi:MAG: hypothetical protein WBG17_05285 [Burkholderiaceae bacterium]
MEDFCISHMWRDAAKRQKDWRDKGEVVLLQTAVDAYYGLQALGWRDITYCPKDGTTFLAIQAGSAGVFPCRYQGEWPTGSWWIEDAGDLWPVRPILFKPMPGQQMANTQDAIKASPQQMDQGA